MCSQNCLQSDKASPDMENDVKNTFMNHANKMPINKNKNKKEW